MAKKKQEDDSGDYAEPLFEDWIRQRLRFGKADDTVILFIPSHSRDKKRLQDQDKWAS